MFQRYKKQYADLSKKLFKKEFRINTRIHTKVSTYLLLYFKQFTTNITKVLGKYFIICTLIHFLQGQLKIKIKFIEKLK